MWLDSFQCGAWCHSYDMTYLCVCHAAVICLMGHGMTRMSCHACILASALIQCVTWRIHLCAMTQLYIRWDSYVVWPTNTWNSLMHSYEWHDSFICATWIIQMCDMTHSLFVPSVCAAATRFHNSFVFVTCLIHAYHICDLTHAYVRHDSFICATWLTRYSFEGAGAAAICFTDSFVYVTWLTYICDVTHWYLRHDLGIRGTRLIYTCDMTHLHVWHDSSIRVTWPVHICDMTYSFVWRDLCLCVTWLVFTRDRTYSYVWYGWGASAVNFNTLQHPAIHCNTLQHNVSFIRVTWLRRLLCGNMFP